MPSPVSSPPCRAALLACAVLATLVLAAPAHAVVSPAPLPSWAADGTVYTSQHLGGYVYLGGSFNAIGRPAGNAASFATADGAYEPSRSPAIGGRGPSTIVSVAISDGAGGQYVGGLFTFVGSSARRNLVHLLADGSVDPAFAPEPNDQVTALALSGSTLYIGGRFTTIAGQSRQFLAALDATTGAARTWAPAPSGGYPSALVVAGGAVFAGGQWNTVNSVAQRGVVKLDPTTGVVDTGWNAGLSFVTNPNQTAVNALAVSGSTLYAVGHFDTASAVTRTSAAAFDVGTGAITSFAPSITSISTTVSSVAVSGSHVYIGGFFSTVGGQTRNGVASVDATTGALDTTWNPSADGVVFGLAVAGSHLYLGGSFETVGGLTRTGLASVPLTGTGAPESWNPSPGSTVTAVSASADHVYAGGYRMLLEPQVRHGLARLDAATGDLDLTWDPNAGNSFATTVRAIAGTAAGPIYLGGSFSRIGATTRTALAAVSPADGSVTSWYPATSVGAGVTTMLLDGTTLYVSGGFTTLNAVARKNAAAFDLAGGTPDTPNAWDPSPNNVIAGFAKRGSTLYAGGSFTTLANGATTRNKLAAFDLSSGTGSAATAWNPGANGDIYSIALSAGGSTLFAAGSFGQLGGATRKYVGAVSTATGTATAWDPEPDQTFVQAVAVSGGTVYVAGNFFHIAGQERGGLAAFDVGSGAIGSWNPTTSDGGLSPQSFTVDADGSLFLGGGFSELATGLRAGIAMFPALPEATTPPAITGTPAAGSSLTCAQGDWLGRGAATFATAWLRDGTPTGIATSTYAVGSADAGHQLVCRVTGTNAYGSGSADSAAVAVPGGDPGGGDPGGDDPGGGDPGGGDPGGGSNGGDNGSGGGGGSNGGGSTGTGSGGGSTATTGGGATGGGTTTATGGGAKTTPAVPKATAPKAADVIALPAAKSCLSKRTITLHIKRPKGVTFTAAVIKVGKKKTTLKGKKVTPSVSLKGLPKGTFVVDVTLTMSNGKTLHLKRTYRTCTAHKKS